jgi:PLP dependent protein
MGLDSDTLRRRLEALRATVDEARRRSGRSQDVRLVAVTKTLAVAEMQGLREAGLDCFGESRVQDALPKLEAFAAGPAERRPEEWHFIGHLQRNKAAAVVGRFDLLHGLDSLALARRISALAAEGGRPQAALLQVNVSGEASKHGFAPTELEGVLSELLTLPGLELRGLMGMAAFGAAEEARFAFRALRELRDGLDPGAERLPELSMGMSGDYEVAVEEGATLIRVGSLLFT